MSPVVLQSCRHPSATCSQRRYFTRPGFRSSRHVASIRVTPLTQAGYEEQGLTAAIGICFISPHRSLSPLQLCRILTSLQITVSPPDLLSPHGEAFQNPLFPRNNHFQPACEPPAQVTSSEDAHRMELRSAWWIWAHRNPQRLTSHCAGK